MTIGDRVRIRLGHVYGGDTGRISEITSATAGQLVYNIVFENHSSYEAQSLVYYSNQIEEIISKPIKLKKFSAWK